MSVAVALLSLACSPDERPPNILMILADDLGAGELGSYGNAANRTPRIDRLASEGMRFETAYATPLCTPSRVLLLTGRYGFRTGWNDLIGKRYAPEPNTPEEDLGEREVTFADVLKEAGYRTAAAGKWQLPGSARNRLFDVGFDTYRIWRWFHDVTPDQRPGGTFSRYWHASIIQDTRLFPTVSDDYTPDLLVDFLIEFMAADPTQPFLAYYTMLLPHPRYMRTPDPRRPGKYVAKGVDSSIAYLDHLVGRLLDALDELGIADQTLVIFMGDNGTADAGKSQLREIGVRVPWIARWPHRIPAGVISPALTDFSDVLPTLADFGGGVLPNDRVLDGKSLKPVLLGQRDHHRDWIFSAFRNRRLLRDDRWLQDGYGIFWDCAGCRDGSCCRDVTASIEPEVIEARNRFSKILEDLPAPEVQESGARRQSDRAADR